MGVLKKKEFSIFSSISGKVGNLIFYTRRNQLCVRSKPLAFKHPSSPGQIAQQERMAAAAIFYQALKKAGIYPYWQKAAEKLPQTGYNLVIKNNLAAFSGEGSICDFSKIRITIGTLPLPAGLKLEADENKGWILQWRNTPLFRKAREDDELLVVMMKNQETFDVKFADIGTHFRNESPVVFQIPETLQDYSHLFVIFCSRTNGECSESRYFNIHL